jgi:hypothetical protein
MRYSTLFLVNSIVALIFGLAFVLVPTTMAETYDADLTEAGLLIGRLFGGTLLMTAVLTWYARSFGPSEERQAIVLALFVSHVVGLVASLLGQLNGVVNGLGWLTVILYLIFAAAYGYLRFVAAPEARPGLST